MEITDLNFFLAVAEAGGISRASTKLHTVQSNISTRIRSLEQELGVELFRRHARGVSLTNAGQAFLPFAERATALMREAAHVVGNEADPTGTLAIGSMETTAGLRLPDILASYTSECPHVDLTLRTGTSADLIDMVIEHHLDGAFVCGPVDHPDLVAELAFVEELALVTTQRTADVREAFAEPQRILVLRSGCAYRARLEQLFADNDVAHPQILEFGSLEGILGCVAAGMGSTLLPVPVVASSPAAPRLRMYHLPPDQARAETMFVRRVDTSESPAMSNFRRLTQLADTPASLRSVGQ